MVVLLCYFVVVLQLFCAFLWFFGFSVVVLRLFLVVLWLFRVLWGSLCFFVAGLQWFCLIVVILWLFRNKILLNLFVTLKTPLIYLISSLA